MSRISIIHKSDKGLIVLLKLEKPLVGAIGDRFIIRSYSPVRTIAGGIIFEIPVNNNWKEIKNISKDVLDLNYKDRIFRIINNSSTLNPLELSDVEKKLNISLNNFEKILESDSRYEMINFKSFNWILTKDRINKLKIDLLNYLEEFHNSNSLSEGCNKNILAQKTNINDDLLIYLLSELLSEDKIKNKSEFWSLKNFTLKLNPKLKDLSNDILIYINNNNFIDKNNISDINSNLSDSEFYGIINYLESENKIIKISPDLFYSYNTLNEIKDKIIRHFKTTDLLTIPEFKEISQTTRKLAVPLLEYLDKINFTYRSENSRKLSRSYNE